MATCPCCSTSKPVTKDNKRKSASAEVKVATSSNVPLTLIAGQQQQASLIDVFKKAGDSWDCLTCMVNNKKSLAVCSYCCTPQPTASNKTLAAAAASSAGGQIKVN